MYGHQARRELLPSYPQFFHSGLGAIVTDCDGRDYIDLMCSWGPIILGHRYPDVEEAAARQRVLGDCLNGPSERLVELAEMLVDTISDADWAIFAKNGTDATTGCLTIARAHTGRRIVLAARGCYHGAAPWCTPRTLGTLPSDRAFMRYFDYNDQASLDDAVRQAGNDLAGILITPFRHVEGEDQEMVLPEFARQARESCDRLGALLMIDDVRCGFRLHRGGSWEPLRIPVDLSAWSKAIANGYPLAAITGAEHVRNAANSVFLTGSFWTNSVPMAAAIATVTALRDQSALPAMIAAGNRLRNEIVKQAREHGQRIRYTGPPTMPYMTFEADTTYERMNVFAAAALEAGLYLHPRHNWFLSTAHTPEIIDRATAATQQAFVAVTAHFGDS